MSHLSYLKRILTQVHAQVGLINMKRENCIDQNIPRLLGQVRTF